MTTDLEMHLKFAGLIHTIQDLIPISSIIAAKRILSLIGPGLDNPGTMSV